MYDAFMSIRRYEHMPFYFYPVVNYQDKALNFMDWLIDAHEDARNPKDRNMNFHMRFIYVWDNFLRYQNDSAGNMMFDT